MLRNFLLKINEIKIPFLYTYHFINDTTLLTNVRFMKYLLEGLDNASVGVLLRKKKAVFR